MLCLGISEWFDEYITEEYNNSSGGGDDDDDDEEEHVRSSCSSSCVLTIIEMFPVLLYDYDLTLICLFGMYRSPSCTRRWCCCWPGAGTTRSKLKTCWSSHK